MSLPVKVLIGLALAAFAVSHVVASYKLEAHAAHQPAASLSMLGAD
jgi:hypothetical protein